MVYLDDVKIEKSIYEGNEQVSIRKWYKDRETGELKPTRSGINLSMEEWEMFVESFDDIVEDIEMS